MTGEGKTSIPREFQVVARARSLCPSPKISLESYWQFVYLIYVTIHRCFFRCSSAVESLDRFLWFLPGLPQTQDRPKGLTKISLAKVASGSDA
jgi:hypothetical protein